MKNVYDLGDKAFFYSRTPTPHYKYEVYKLFNTIINSQRHAKTILDVGAGNGALEIEYKKIYGLDKRFILMDQSETLLSIAKDYLGVHDNIFTCNYDFNMHDWPNKIGVDKVDMIVSNNAIFHIKPDSMQTFWNNCSRIANQDGIVLIQTAMKYAGNHNPYHENRITKFMKSLPYDIMPQFPQLSEYEYTRYLEKSRIEKELQEKIAYSDAEKVHSVSDVQYYFYEPSEMMQYMKISGFTSTIIWQKKEFYILLGIK